MTYKQKASRLYLRNFGALDLCLSSSTFAKFPYETGAGEVHSVVEKEMYLVLREVGCCIMIGRSRFEF